MTLEDRRERAAQAEFESYELGRDDRIEDADGWERTVPGNEWTRTLYLASESGASIRGTFTVVFAEGSDQIISAYATADGVEFGRRGPATR